ncbi:hypothetical protein ACFWNN_45355 [Lentzea sp. NPDC058450]|uniref:hypothetical protein n=1 Tax=Lentzea sp. NPDC058450 TaxID=3346505 RepID=UPI0036659FA4
MIRNFKIDQAATFAGVVFLSCKAKTVFGSTEQDRTKDGTPKWEVEVLGAFYGFNGETTNEVVKIGISSNVNPTEGLAAFRPVELVNFEVGVMEKTKKNPDGSEKVIGVTVWYRATQVRDIAETVIKPGTDTKAA